jgi:hypothetical protein
LEQQHRFVAVLLGYWAGQPELGDDFDFVASFEDHIAKLIYKAK